MGNGVRKSTVHGQTLLDVVPKLVRNDLGQEIWLGLLAARQEGFRRRPAEGKNETEMHAHTQGWVD